MAERRRRRAGRSGRAANTASEPGTGHVFGLHAVRSVIDRRPQAIRRAWLLEGTLRGPLAELELALLHAGCTAERLPRTALNLLAQGGTHQGVVLEVQPLASFSLTEFEDLVSATGSALRLLVLDQVEDPRNLGACLRSAAAAGIHAIVVPKDRAAPLSAAAVKAAAGAAELVPVVRVTNLARTLRFLSEAGVRIVGAAADAPQTLYDTPLAAPLAVVLGSEGAGLRRLTRECCDALFRIPMHSSVESLNVSVTAGIVLFEALRRA